MSINLSTPTPPITEALVGGTPALLEMLRSMASKDPALAEAFRRYEVAILSAQNAARLVTQLIENRLKAVESVAKDIEAAGGGGVLRLSDDLPLPVGTAADSGSGLQASRWDHVHVGVLSVGGKTGAVSLVDEEPSGTMDGVNDTFTLSAVPLWGFLEQNGVVLADGGEDYTLTGLTIVYVAGKIPEATDHHRWRGIA